MNRSNRVLTLVAAIAVSATPAVGAAAPPARATLHHVPPSEVAPGAELRLLAVIDDAWVEEGMVARYRVAGRGGRYATASFERSSAGGYHAIIPASAVVRPGVEYYVAGLRGGRAHFASAAAPHLVRVEPPASQRWVDVELARLRGRLYGMAARVEVQDFGHVHGRDRHVRAETDWTYRLVGRLYSITLGYALLDGVTPSGTDDMAVELDRGARWGYGGFRLRLHDALWLDARVMMGIGEEGFLSGVGGQVIFGDDWRTCVMVGAEALEELSYRGWVTLQWDTVPPFLMQATAMSTDQPDARIDAGSTVRYQVALPLTDTMSVAAHAAFGARGNRPGWFGGGLATSFDF